jgi:hypothetical protein
VNINAEGALESRISFLFYRRSERSGLKALVRPTLVPALIRALHLSAGDYLLPDFAPQHQALAHVELRVIKASNVDIPASIAIAESAGGSEGNI